MIDITIKTLDSRNHSFSVEDELTVKQLKEHIAEPVNVPAESQRLIYCGRVLHDDKKLSECDVHGKVIHLVQRAPPSSSSSNNNSSNEPRAPSSSSRRPWRLIPGSRVDGNAMYLGAMAFPADLIDAQGITLPQPRHALSQSRLSVARSMLRRARNTLATLENPGQEVPPENSTSSGDDLPRRIAMAAQAAFAAVLSTEVSVASTTAAPSEEGAAATQQSSGASATSEQPSASNPEENQNTSSSSSGTGRSTFPGTSCLAELISQVNDINRRLQPFLDEYYNLMNDDPVLESHAPAQTLFNQVSETLHFMAHAYHALSDVMCDFSRPPPRLLRCRPVLIQHSAVLQTGFPVQAQLNISARTNQESSINTTASGEGATAGSSAAVVGSAPASTTRDGAAAANPDNAGSSSTDNPAPPTALNVAAVSEGPDEPRHGAEPVSHPSVQVFRTSLNDLVSSGGTHSQSSRAVPMFGTSAEVFMDVGLGSITIDSMEAAAVAPNSSSQGAAGEPIPTISGPFAISTSPPSAAELFHNFMQSLAGTIFTNGPSTTVSTTSANNSSSTSTTVTSQESSSTSTNSQARGNTATNPTTATQTRSTTRPHVHIGPGFQSMTGQGFFDPFLPCSSHHIRGSRRRNTSQQQTAANGSGPNEQRETVALANSEPQLNSSAIPLSPTSIGVAATLEELQSLHPSSGRYSAAGISDAFTAFRSIFSDQTMPQARQQDFISNSASAMSVGEVFQIIFPTLQQQNDDPFILFFMDLARQLRVGDILNVDGLNPTAVISNLRRPLTQAMKNLIGCQEPTSGQITDLINRINSKAKTFLEALVSNTELTFLRDDVDIVATFSLFNHTLLPALIRTILDEDDEQYNENFTNQCDTYARHLTYIWLYYCNYSDTGVTSVLIYALERLLNDIPFTFMAMARARFMSWQRKLVTTTNHLMHCIQPYLVYRMAEATPETQMEEASAQSVSSPSQPQPMETEPSAEITLSPLGDPLPEPLPDVIIGAEPWHSAVPPDWVPIITHDRERQRRQAVQGPLSEAYLSGMPSKRRKVVSSTKPNGNLTRVISESMSTALGAAGVVDGDELADRAGSDTNLRAAYREQVKMTVETTLKNHPDYKPDKYPNASKLFGPK